MLTHRLGGALVGLFAQGVVRHLHIGRKMAVHRIDRRPQIAALCHAGSETGIKIGPPTVAHFIHHGIRQHFVQKYGIGKRPCPRIARTRLRGVMHILTQQVEPHRIAVAGGHISNQKGHRLPLRTGRVAQQQAQAVGPRTGGKRRVEQRFVSGGNAATVPAAASTEQSRKKEQEKFLQDQHDSSCFRIRAMSASSHPTDSYSGIPGTPPIETSGLR